MLTDFEIFPFKLPLTPFQPLIFPDYAKRTLNCFTVLINKGSHFTFHKHMQKHDEGKHKQGTNIVILL